MYVEYKAPYFYDKTSSMQKTKLPEHGDSTRRAYEGLEAEGFTINMAGKGAFVAPQNMELLRENRLVEIEKKLEDILEYAKPVGILGEDLKKIIDELSQEE